MPPPPKVWRLKQDSCLIWQNYPLVIFVVFANQSVIISVIYERSETFQSLGLVELRIEVGGRGSSRSRHRRSLLECQQAGFCDGRFISFHASHTVALRSFLPSFAPALSYLPLLCSRLQPSARTGQRQVKSSLNPKSGSLARSLVRCSSQSEIWHFNWNLG